MRVVEDSFYQEFIRDFALQQKNIKDCECILFWTIAITQIQILGWCGMS